MKIHLVGGFLGSGKTTAIIAASKTLAARGERVGVITNDQGKYLVDTAFFKAADIPAVEVTGGCFCCNYTDYREMVRAMEADTAPTHLFAESVGSCSDLVATVIRPSELEAGGEVASFSGFADIRLVKIWLSGVALPFGREINYLFEKQMEEAGLLVLNKSDLLPNDETLALHQAVSERFPGKRVRLQSSLSTDSVTDWLREIIESAAYDANAISLNIDYERYGAAEASLAWYDAVAKIDAGAEPSSHVVTDFARTLNNMIRTAGYTIGHFKLLAQYAGGAVKLSVVAAQTDVETALPDMGNGDIEVVINARVECAPAELAKIVHAALTEACARNQRALSIRREDSFSPSYPNPTHRIP